MNSSVYFRPASLLAARNRGHSVLFKRTPNTNTGLLKVFKETLDIHSETPIKRINTLRGKSAEVFDV
jgi:hypothetical protein